MRKRVKIQDGILRVLMASSSFIVMGILVLVVGYIVVQGAGHIDWQFLSGDFDDDTRYVDVITTEQGLLADVSVVNYDTKDYLEISQIDSSSPLRSAVANSGELFPLKAGDILRKVEKENTVDMSADAYYELEDKMPANTKVRLKITRPGEGVFPLIINTLYMIGLTLLIAIPISICAAIYIAEYAKQGRVLQIIRFATNSLAGIPSIIFGLFGMLIFVKVMNLGYSMLAGSLTLSIVLLPTVISQTEEAVRRVPLAFREGSFALGATKLQTIFRIILPNSISGIMVGVMLGIGRIVAESAALLLTAGTVAAIAESMFKGAATLTVKAYAIAKETGDIKLASAVGIVAIVLIIVVNAAAKLVERLDKMKDVV